MISIRRANCLAKLLGLWSCLLVLGIVYHPAISIAQSTEQFSCADTFGSGFTPHPGFPFTCCYPGTTPVSGEPRCVSPGQAQQSGGTEPSGAGSGGASNAPGDLCIPLGAVCTLHGTPCCGGTCAGDFPNTFCQ